MANTFTRKSSQNIGTTLVTVGGYTVSGSNIATVIGLSLCNKTNSSITANVILNNTTTNTFISHTATIPGFDTLIVVGGEQKLVMIPNDNIRVQSNVASSIDAVMSILEIS